MNCQETDRHLLLSNLDSLYTSLRPYEAHRLARAHETNDFSCAQAVAKRVPDLLFPDAETQLSSNLARGALLGRGAPCPSMSYLGSGPSTVGDLTTDR